MKKLILPVLVIPLIISCQHTSDRGPASEKPGKKEVRQHFRNLPVEERLEYLRKARVFSDKYDPASVAQMDPVAELERKCGPLFRYQKTQFNSSGPSADYGTGKTIETFAWPQIECRYKPDDGGFGGYTQKFACEFPDEKAPDGWDTKKVKYAKLDNQPVRSEVIDTLISSMSAKLVGFHTETYCPARVICRNCPSEDPWKNNRAQGAPSNDSHDFEWTIIEEPLDAIPMSNSRPAHPMAQGVQWAELREVQTADPGLARQMLIEREAWMLWLNFLQHWDAGHFNQRISCQKFERGADGKPVCVKSVLYTHDWGHTFGRRFDFYKWSRREPLVKNSQGPGCRGGLQNERGENTPIKGEIFEPLISAEARDLLVDRLSRVSDSQWASVFQLARTEEATNVTPGEFIKAMKKKIRQMREAPCLPFDSNQSVLALKTAP